MTIRQTRFGYAPRAAQQQESRVSIFEPTQGFDGGQAPQELLPGFTPASQNFVHDGGYLTPRSGMSLYDATYSLGDAGLFGMEVFDTSGRRSVIAASAGTFGYLASGALSWSNLSWVPATGASNQTPASTVEEAWDGAAVYEPARDKNIAVLTNNRQLPKYLNIEESTTTFSDYTWCVSQFSTARSVTEFDNRLVFFNVSSTASVFPTRVIWTPRGNPIDLTISNGAGYEDLMDMQGSGLRVFPDRDSILLFSDEQIWRGRKRGDFYAFDFYCISRDEGCPYPRTIHETPYGIVFLGRDRELKLLRGDDVVPLGPTGKKGSDVGDASRIQLYLRQNMQNGNLAHACYNSQQQQSELYFTSNETNANLYPQKRLDYKWDNQSFLMSATSLDWSMALEIQDVDEAVTWDSVPYNWNDYNTEWNLAGLGASDRRVVAFSSSGTPYRFRSDQTSDSGQTIDCRWRSHGLGSYDAFRYDTLYEVWADYNSPSTSTVGIHTSANLGVTWQSSFTRTLSASSISCEMWPVYQTAQAPLFEMRVNDGSQPRFSRLQVRLRDAGLYSGAK